MTFTTTKLASPLTLPRRSTLSGRSLAVLAATLLTLPALADTYSFTSPNYVSGYIGGPGPTGAYNATMRVTGSFSTAAPLPPNMPLTPIGPGAATPLVTSWTFSDGVRTYTAANAALLYGLPVQFAVATDASGQVIDYRIELIQPLPPHALGQVVTTLSLTSLRTQVVGNATCQSVSAGTPVVCNSVLQAGASESAQGPGGGTWLRAADPAAVPTLSLAGLGAMGAALAGVAAWARRRRRG
jgi:hypothetical protein